jgi:ankyrin repeat protein
MEPSDHMTIKILPPDEAAKRARERVAEWKRQKEIDTAKGRLEARGKIETPTDDNRNVKRKNLEGRTSRKKMRQDFQLFWNCIQTNDLKGARDLISDGADVNSRSLSGKTPLIIAAGYSRTGIVELLIANGADVNATDRNGLSALKSAARQGSLPVTEMLISNGADVKANTGVIAIAQSAFHLGKKSERMKVVEILRKHGATE